MPPPKSNDLHGISPSEVADALPSRPILSTGPNRLDRAVLQRFKHPPSLIELPPVRDHIVVLNLSGPTLIEQPQENGWTLRRWTDAGHLSLTPAGSAVTRTLKGRPDVLLLHLQRGLVRDVECDAFGDVQKPGELAPQLAVADALLNQLGHLLLAEAEDGSAPGAALASNFLVRSLIIQVLRRYKHDAAKADIELAASADHRIERALTFMREHFQDKLTADQLADISGTSRSSFSRLFREAVGQSAYQHLMTIRLNHALDLLEKTALSVTEVAYSSGFGQPTHFATVFREHFGVSPRAWRSANSQVEEVLIGQGGRLTPPESAGS